MLIKFGSIVTEGSGSLGSHTVQNSHGGMQLRTKPHPRGIPSASQVLIRSINPVLQAGWHTLTDAQRKIWNDWPVTHGIFNAKGDKHTLSGHSLWMKYQYGRLVQNLPFMSDPSKYLLNYLGPERIINGSFSINANWILNAGYTIHDGMMFILNPPLFAYQTAVVALTSWYQVQFDLLNYINGQLKIGLGGAEQGPLFSASGHYIYNFYKFVGGAEVFIYARGFPANYQVDNVSVKFIYNY